MTTPVDLTKLSQDERLKIFDRIKKLHAKAESAAEIGSQHEAEAFAAAVSKMLNLYQVEMSDVEYELQGKNDPMALLWYSPVTAKADPAEAMQYKHRILPLETLMMAIAEANNCQIVMSQERAVMDPNAVGAEYIDKQGVKYTHRHWCYAIVGRKSATAVTAWQFTTLARAMYRLAQQAYVAAKKDGTYAKGFYQSFYLGYARAIASRLHQMRRDMKAEVVKTSGSKALIRLTNELDKATEARNEYFKRLKNMGGLGGGGTNSDAYAQGHRAGREQNLGQTGVGGGQSKSAGQLKSGN